MNRLIRMALAAALIGGTVVPAGATAVTVQATDNIYDAGGSLAAALSVSGGAIITFSNVTGSTSCATSTEGCITVNSGGNLNDADGTGGGTTTSINSGSVSLSGVSAPGAGFIVGVFLAAGGPSGTAPSALDFTGPGATAFTSLSPLLDQVFFVGDGLTGDGTGSTQQFVAPSGAATLYLGLSDACGYNGSPGCFGDNSGSYSLSVFSSVPVPEPFSLALMAPAVAGIALLRRRKRG